MPTILDTITKHKRAEIIAAKEQVPFAMLEQQLATAPPVRDFIAALRSRNSSERLAEIQLIAEIKKASPSAGIIRDDFDPVQIATIYEQHGAACLSVLTDEHFFQGHLDFLRDVRANVSLPVMRKEFILDRYQILEARVAGADCVLLIAECLDDATMRDLFNYATELGMSTLIELYEPENLPRVLSLQPPLVGINNRDLRTFQTDLSHSMRLAESVPPETLLVSESGIRTAADLQELQQHNINAILVGETLMRSPDIGNAVDQLLKPLC